MSRPVKFPRLPDLLTTGNLCCGVLSILIASQGGLTLACWLIFLAALFDVFDGMVARALGGGSPLGAQLDSLADMVSFGVAPGMLMYYAFNIGIMWSLPNNELLLFSSGDAPGWVLPILVLVISAASAWRLAKFNIDTRQSTKFLGLATPANALFWASLPLTIASNAVWGPGSLYLRKWLTLHLAMQPIVALVLALVLGALMLSELPLPSLKFTHKGWKGNEVIFLLVGIGVLLAVLYGILAVPLILVIYLLSPLWGKAFKKDRSNRNEATAQRERNVDL